MAAAPVVLRLGIDESRGHALVTPFPVLAGESVDDAAIFFLETTLQLYKNSRGGKQISMGGCV